ncbi:MAG: glycosyltransferase family 39 protein [Pegethrix bostrychoides GSE-TBD4-15B]|jgi:uncharacterized membrane protein|uniref:Glycosyltransferase family 39 protein n=1 Tax=Pegethrix bostrychoides GSE-TBD4-15B TaxID=2839662 RepID=A0A951P8M4_9CYAN|nr:glycosyltransferase family 39 protein [Pegethrix bostrychoides GSE-TBD4-15B]
MTQLLATEQVRPVSLNWLKLVLIALLVLGVCFRFTALDRKIFWHDEVYTVFRAAGFTRDEIDRQLFQNRFVSVPELQSFQQIKPDSSALDSLRSLAVEDPQHPPLYFLMARFWMQALGSSISTSRLLPALISLISLPLMYGLAMELFSSRPTALLATVFLALSPFDLLFAQTARQYSLLTMTVIGSSWLLLRAMRTRTGSRWVDYGMSVAVGLYAHPFFGLTVIAQGVYLGLMTFMKPAVKTGTKPPGRRLLHFALAILGALLVYGPWLSVLLERHGRATATTNWTNEAVGLLYLLKLWVLSFTALWFDLDFGFNNPLTYLLRLPVLLLIGMAFQHLYRHSPLRVWLFLVSSALVPFLILALPDLVLGGKRSAVSRYLISCFPAVQLAVAYLFTTRLSLGQFTPGQFKLNRAFWRVVLALTFAGSILSAGVSAQANSWWSKDLSYLNGEVIQRLNAEPANSILLSNMGNDYTNTGDLISLSYGLRPDLRLFLVSDQPDFAPLTTEPNLLAFRPSEPLKASMMAQGWRLEPIDPISASAKLWRIRK